MNLFSVTNQKIKQSKLSNLNANCEATACKKIGLASLLSEGRVGYAGGSVQRKCPFCTHTKLAQNSRFAPILDKQKSNR